MQLRSDDVVNRGKPTFLGLKFTSWEECGDPIKCNKAPSNRNL